MAHRSKGDTVAEHDANARNSGSNLVYARLALGMAVFGSAAPVSKIVTGAMPVFVASLLRVALDALVLAPFVGGRWHQARHLGRSGWLLVGLISLLGMFGFSALTLYGMRMVSGVVGAVVMSTAPPVTAAGSILFMGMRRLGERSSRSRWRRRAC